MKFRKLIGGFVLFFFLLELSSCSFYKSNQSYQTGTDINNDELTRFSDIGNKTNFDKNTNLQMRKNNTVYFALNQYNIQPLYLDMLESHAIFLRSNPSLKVIIQGHADERGTPEYNIALGERRANAVKLYLQEKGVLMEQILIVSYGEEKPAVLGHNENAYAKNRRAILIF